LSVENRSVRRGGEEKEEKGRRRGELRGEEGGSLSLPPISLG